MLSHELEKIRAVLKDPDQSEFVPVTIPEAMSILETEKLLDSVDHQDVAVRNIIVNRIASDQDCPYCATRGKEHEKGLAEIHSKFSPYNIIHVPVFAHEVRGVENLDEIVEILYGDKLPK